MLLASTALRYYTYKTWDKTLFITWELSLESQSIIDFPVFFSFVLFVFFLVFLIFFGFSDFFLQFFNFLLDLKKNFLYSF